jgi:hypothetical protein
MTVHTSNSSFFNHCTLVSFTTVENGIIDRVIIEGSDAGDSYVPFFNASTDSNRDDSVVVLPQLAPTIEYTYFSTAGMSDDGFEDESEEDEFIQTYMAQAERQSERVLGSARRPIGHVVYTMFMGDKVPGAMPMLLAASALR